MPVDLVADARLLLGRPVELIDELRVGLLEHLALDMALYPGVSSRAPRLPEAVRHTGLLLELHLDCAVPRPASKQVTWRELQDSSLGRNETNSDGTPRKQHNGLHAPGGTGQDCPYYIYLERTQKAGTHPIARPLGRDSESVVAIPILRASGREWARLVVGRYSLSSPCVYISPSPTPSSLAAANHPLAAASRSPGCGVCSRGRGGTAAAIGVLARAAILAVCLELFRCARLAD